MQTMSHWFVENVNSFILYANYNLIVNNILALASCQKKFGQPKSLKKLKPKTI